MDQTYETRWREKERHLGLQDIQTEMVTSGTWLLPHDAAPCLTFDVATALPRVWEVFRISSEWLVTNRNRLERYRVLGSDGAGNPICLESDSGSVWLLDHEDRFQTRQFVNSSIAQLAECLLAYMGEQDAERFRRAVNATDARAITEGSFWFDEARGLESQ